MTNGEKIKEELNNILNNGAEKIFDITIKENDDDDEIIVTLNGTDIPASYFSNMSIEELSKCNFKYPFSKDGTTTTTYLLRYGYSDQRLLAKRIVFHIYEQGNYIPFTILTLDGINWAYQLI